MERIVDAAETVFADVGYAAATTTRIAQEANVAIGSVYEFFADKQAVAQTLAARYITALPTLYHADPGDADDDPPRLDLVLAGTVDAADRMIRRHPALGPLLQADPKPVDDHSLRRSLHAGLTDHLHRLLATRLPSTDPTRGHAIATMCAMLVRFALEQLAATAPDDRAALVAEIKLAVAAYLAGSLPPP